MRAQRRVLGIILLTGAFIAAGCTSDSGVQVKDRTTTGETVTSETVTGDTTEPTDSTPTTDDPVVDSLDWGTCTDESASDPSLECATLTVPLDYGDPTGETIDIALVRVPATGDRTGAILLNPGGPGGSGFEFGANNGGVIQSELGLDNFDIVGFDPRGVDRSNGIRCVDDAFQDKHLYLDDTPDTPEEQQLLDEGDTGVNKACTAKYGDTLKFYSTENTARDMDLIRQAMGDDQISYLGISYGTYLGAVYATLFPDNLRAAVLDSAYEPNGDTVEEQYLTQLVGFEGAFNEWAKWCQDDDTCAFHAADVGARWDALRQQLDDQPVTAADGREGNQAVMDTATTAALYSESEWPVLADALAKAEAGDVAGIFALADNYEQRSPDGTFSTLFQSFNIIRCASGIRTQPPTDAQALLDKIHQQAPRFGGDVTLEDLTGKNKDGDISGCNELTGPTTPVELSYSGDGPIVVVGGTNDPATPIRWAEEMTKALGSNATMVTFTGEGHGQLLASTCVTDIEAAMLADLTSPDPGTVCDPDPAIEQPAWWGNLVFPADFSDVVSLPAVNGALGLTDTQGYAEIRTTPLGEQAALDELDKALTDAGFQPVAHPDLKIDGVVATTYLSPTGEPIVFIAMGPTAFDTEDLSGAKASVPPGQTVVLYVYLPQ